MQGMISLLVGALLSLILTQIWENIILYKNRFRGFSGSWLVSMQSLDSTVEDEWTKEEKVTIKHTLGYLIIKTNSWEARLRSVPIRSLSGRWRSLATTSEAEGAISLALDVHGQYMFGTLVSLDRLGQKKIQNIAFGSEKIQDALLSAKQQFITHDLYRKDDIIKHLRTNFYQYHSSLNGGKKIWIATSLDFSVENPCGYLIARTSLSPAPESSHIFIFKGYALGTTLTLITHGVETPDQKSHFIYPRIPLAHRRIVAGIIYQHTWDNKIAFSQCIISKKPLLDGKFGLVNAKYHGELEKLWRDEIAQICPLNFQYP